MAKSSDKKIALIPYLSSSMRIFQIVPTTNITMKGVMNEIDSDDYTEEENFTNLSLQELSDGTAGTINTSNASEDRPDGVAPHALGEFANYDHDISGTTAPSGLSVTSQTTSTITFGYQEGNQNTKTYVTLVNFNGSTAYANQNINEENFDGSFPDKYQTVDGSGTSAFTLGSSNDLIFAAGTPQAITFGANDYIIIKIRGRNSGGTYTSYTGNVTGYTLPGLPSSFAMTSAVTVTNGYGDGNDGAYTVTLNWNAPTGGVSSYRVTHGTNSSRTHEDNTQDVVVNSGTTTLAITGVNNNDTYYGFVKSVGGGGDSSNYASTNVTLLHTYFYNVIANLTLSGVVSSGISNTVTSDPLQFNVGNRANLALTCTSTAPAGGSFSYSISGTGDPGTSGTGNSATGFINEGSTATLAHGSFNANVIYVRFRFTTNTSAGSINRTVTFSHNNVNDTVVVTCTSTSAGPPGPPKDP